MPRILAVFALIAAACAALISPVLAQDATPTVSILAGQGLPEVHIILTSNGIQLPTVEITAGQILVVVEAEDQQDGVVLVKIPEGMTIDDFMPPTDPVTGSPVAEEQTPVWLFTSAIVGGAFAAPGAPGMAVVTVEAGDYMVASFSDAAPVAMTVGAGPARAPIAIPFDHQVTLEHFQITLPADLQAGRQVWEITNTFDQPHELFLAKTPRLLTLDEAQMLINFDPSTGATPPAGLPDPSTFEQIGISGPISHGQTVDVEVDLQPGTYVALCFMPDKETGQPHAMKGMYTIFEIGADGSMVSPAVSPVPMEMGTPVS